MKILYLLLGAVCLMLLISTVGGGFGSGNEVTTLGDWAKEQIKSELSIFEKSKFTTEDIDKTYNTLSAVSSNELIRFKIKDGVVSSNFDELQKNNSGLEKAHTTLYNFFKHMIKAYGFTKNVDFVVSVGDGLEIPQGFIPKAPIIVPVKIKSDDMAAYKLIAPDHYIISEWPSLYNDILNSNIKYVWNRKIEKAFWRGSSSGGVYTRSNWQDFPRMKLLELSSLHPALLDAKLTSLTQDDDNLRDEIAEKYPIAIYVSQADHTKYKIQIAMEGGLSSLSSELWRLLSNSVLLKQKSNNIKWFYPILQEGKHFISINYDVSDLIEKIDWVLAHDSESEEIASRASSLIKKEIPPSHLYLYWVELLSEYSKLYKS
ncbi:MAG UNVERIFIED_CONTAM: glycosyltransferase family 90 protein [Rickettsiaceae bacterium]|jgi:hypothetical protein